MIQLSKLNENVIILLKENSRRGWSYDTERLARIQSMSIAEDNTVSFTVQNYTGDTFNIMIGEIDEVVEFGDLVQQFCIAEAAARKMDQFVKEYFPSIE